MAEIYKSLERAYNFLEQLDYNVFVITLYGSQNYGLDTPDSDLDYKAIVIPSIDDVVCNRKPVSTSYEFEGGLIDVKDIRLMFENYKKQNLNFIETLFTLYFWINPAYVEEWREILDIADDIAKADPARALKAMYGMALEKQHALCHPYPSKMDLIKKYGYDGKQLSHIYRILHICKRYINSPNIWYGNYIMLDGTMSDRDKQFLIDIKTYAIKHTAEEAKLLADITVNEIKELVDNALANNNYKVNIETYEKLDAIKAKIIKKAFIKELK